MRYAIVIETGSTGVSAYFPDLPGCVAVAETEEELQKMIPEVVEFHLEGLRAEGLAIPPPQSRVDYVEIRSAA